MGCACAQLATAAVLSPGSALAATPISPDRLGVNFTGVPSDLATASAAGVGLARDQVIAGSNTDAVVGLTAAAHLRLYPMLGLPRSQGPAADASAMAAFVTSFAQRYGRAGSFWAQHPELPYLPVESYEIGNEPDITPTAPADSTSLHYADPAAYAEVYETARAALHQVDPAAQAVVGGMLDSGAIGLDQAEQYLAAIGPVDAVGYHPYLYDVTRMEQDTLALRQWLDGNGHAGVPLDINEFGAAAGVTAGPAAWGAQVAQYTQWALCTPALDVEDVQAFWWGAVPLAANDPWFSMVDSAAVGDSARNRLPGGGPDPDVTGMPRRASGSARDDALGAAQKRITVHSKRKARRRPLSGASARRRHPRKPAHRRAARRRAVKHR